MRTWTSVCHRLALTEPFARTESTITPASARPDSEANSASWISVKELIYVNNFIFHCRWPSVYWLWYQTTAIPILASMEPNASTVSTPSTASARRISPDSCAKFKVIDCHQVLITFNSITANLNNIELLSCWKRNSKSIRLRI